MVAATVGVVGKELIGCKFNVSGCCGAVRHRITPAIDDVLRPAASGEKTDTPHQSTAMNRKREGRLYTPSFTIIFPAIRAICCRRDIAKFFSLLMSPDCGLLLISY